MELHICAYICKYIYMHIIFIFVAEKKKEKD